MAQLRTSLSHFRKQPLRSDDRLAFLIIHKWGENKTFVAISCIIWSVSNRTTFTAMFYFPLIAHLPTSLMQNVIMAKFFYQYSWQIWNHVWKLCVVIVKDRANIATMPIHTCSQFKGRVQPRCDQQGRIFARIASSEGQVNIHLHSSLEQLESGRKCPKRCTMSQWAMTTGFRF